MGRAPCCDKEKVKRGPWSPEEDAKLKSYIQDHGTGGNWIALPQKIGLKRCGKSCRLRWLNYLRPNIKHGGFSPEEDNIICTLYMSIGSRWSIIAAQLPGRTDNDIKNYWNTRLKKKLLGKQRKEVQYTRRSSSSCFVKVKQQHEIKKMDHDPNSFPQANISNLQTQPTISDYCTPKQHPTDHNTNMSFLVLSHQYPISYTTTTDGHPPHPRHLITKTNEEASTNFDLPFNMSSSNLDHHYQLPPYDNIYSSLDFQVSSMFNNNNPTTINSTCDSQLSNTSDLLLSYINNFPSTNNYDQMDETILYGFDEMSSLCGVDMVNPGAAGSFTGTSHSADSTSSWNIA